MGLPDGHYRIKYSKFDDTFDTGGSEIVAGPMTKDDAVKFKADNAKQHIYHGINCEFDMRVHQGGNWHHMHHATGEATEHRTHITIHNENTYKPPRANTVSSKEQEDEETRLIGERMSKEVGYDVTSRNSRTVSLQPATHGHSGEEPEHSFREGYELTASEAYGGKSGTVTGTQGRSYVMVHHTDGSEGIYHCTDLAESSVELERRELEDENEIRTKTELTAVLDDIGYEAAEIPEMIAKLDGAPAVKKYLMSGVISSREDLESVLVAASRNVKQKELSR